MANKASSKNKPGDIVGYIVIIAIIIAIGVAIFYVYKAQQLSQLPPQESQTAQQQNGPRPTPTPLPRPIPHGKMTFTASTSWPGPKFSGGIIDPYDPPQGGTLTITVNANDTAPVQKIWMVVKSDHKTSAPIPMHEVSGTSLSGAWQGSWTVDDTYNYTYMVTIQAQSTNGYTKDDLALR